MNYTNQDYIDKVLIELGWYGEYAYKDLCITDQLYINQRVEALKLQDRVDNRKKELSVE